MATYRVFESAFDNLFGWNFNQVGEFTSKAAALKDAKDRFAKAGETPVRYVVTVGGGREVFNTGINVSQVDLGKEHHNLSVWFDVLLSAEWKEEGLGGWYLGETGKKSFDEVLSSFNLCAGRYLRLISASNGKETFGYF